MFVPHQPTAEWISSKLPTVQTKQLIYRFQVTGLNEYVSAELTDLEGQHLGVLEVWNLLKEKLLEVVLLEVVRQVRHAQVEVLRFVLQQLGLHAQLGREDVLGEDCFVL